MTVFLAVAVVTAYVPMAGGINGGACISRDWQACPYPTGTAACGRWPSGTVLELPGWVTEYGFPTTVVCRGGGGPAVDVDLALTSADVAGDLSRAFQWGRRRVEVRVTLPTGIRAIAPPQPARLDRQAAHKRAWRARKDIQ